MADDNTRRSYRSNDPYRRSTEPPGGGHQPSGSDPLAELARLIGKSDPFAEFGQGSPRRAEPPRAAPPASDWRKTVAAMPPFETLQHEPELEPEEPPAPHYAAPHPGFERRDPYPLAAADEPRDDPHADDARFHHRYVDEQQFAHAGHAQDHRDDGRYAGEQPHAQGAPYYEEGAPVGPHDEGMYDDPPRSRGRNGLITAVTLIGCAMIGTAGAYGYRTYVVSGASKNPPVITAETTPNKVVASIDSQPTKSIQDRVREQGQNERVVSREEQPVELKNPPVTSAPRIVLPAPVAPSQFQTGAPALPSPAGGNASKNGGQQPAATAPAASTAAGSEPKRIRTVTIRPDGTDLSGRPVTGMAPAQPATAPARTGSIPKSGQPGRSGPLSLDPQASASAAPPPSARDRAASAPPPPAVPAQDPPAPRLASAPANVGTGGYAVQLSSQKSEAEAQSSFRSLQAKFPDQLGNRSPIVRRADLGDKGIYYRAMVGPFGSSDEAGRFCSSLKAAGGQCIIQKN